MRYLIDPEFRAERKTSAAPQTVRYAAALRSELSDRNRVWAIKHRFAHEVSLGGVPAVLYREDEQGNHGNFLAASYRCIKNQPQWSRRLTKVHTTAKRALLSRDPSRRELDSSNSSDALLMNIFCHPGTLTRPVRQFLGIDIEAMPVFGYKPKTPLTSGKRDATEIDMKLGNLLIEAKLTEYDFQAAPERLVEQYNGFKEVFDIGDLELAEGKVQCYQLIRGVLAAQTSPNARFCVLCDARRPDLIAGWHRLLLAVKPYHLRCRLQVLTWQELAAVLPSSLQSFLEEKYGIAAACRAGDP